MKISDLHHAMQYIDEKYLDMADYPEKERCTMPASENKNYIDRKFYLTRPALAAVISCLVLVLGVSAFAGKWFALRELWNNPNRTLPDTAVEYIQSEYITAAGNGWKAEITESLGDSSMSIAVIDIHADEKYILVPTDASPDDAASSIGLTSPLTLSEYAAAKHKILLYAGAAFQQIGGENVSGSSQHFERVSENEMMILTHSIKTASISAPEAVCTVYVREEGSTDVQKAELSFTLNEAPDTAVTLYRAISPESIPGLTTGELRFTQSPLGYHIEMPLQIMDPQIWDNLLTMKIEGISYGEGGGFTSVGNGNYMFHAAICQGEPGDTLTVYYYNWDKEIMGRMDYQKISE